MSQLAVSNAPIARGTRGISQGINMPSAVPFVLFAFLHAPLALIMRDNPLLATLHAIGVLAVGLLVIIRYSQPTRLIYVCGYIAGAELLWRMNDAQIFWEFGKYSTSLLIIIALFRYRRVARADKRPLVFFLLLLPSSFLAITFDDLSFHLSGPLSLAVITMFLSTVKLTLEELQRILLLLSAPIIGLVSLATTSTLELTEESFGRSSNFQASGGIGPNQMSAMLGLGALVFFLLAVTNHRSRILQIIMGSCAVWLAAQAALTFSRGGIYTSFGAIAIAIIYMLRSKKVRLSVLIGGSLLVFVSSYAIFPLINDFTGGKLLQRFENTESTGRDQLVQADLIAFSENWMFGTGPGLSRPYHALLFRSAAAPHTEYTRMLAEHGLLGLVAVLVLGFLVVQRLLTPGTPMEKSLSLALTTWALLFMAYAAMRLVAPSFVFGLGSIIFAVEGELRQQRTAAGD